MKQPHSNERPLILAVNSLKYLLPLVAAAVLLMTWALLPGMTRAQNNSLQTPLIVKQILVPEPHSPENNVAIEATLPVEFDSDEHSVQIQYKVHLKGGAGRWTDSPSTNFEIYSTSTTVIRIRYTLPRPGSFDLRLRLSDGDTHSPWAEIRVRPNKASPQFPSDTITRSIVENLAPGANVGAPVVAADTDGDTLTYTLSGADASSFSISASSGQITANSTLDYEAKSSYSVTVSADDGRGGTGAIVVSISVTDANEPPQFPSDTTTRSVAENLESGAKVGEAVAATDPNGDTLAYSLSGEDAGSFSIDASTGQITANSSLDYETKNSYSVTVSADDGNGGSDTVKVAISVIDIPEPPRSPV